jgi:hypothetical protein
MTRTLLALSLTAILAVLLSPPAGADWPADAFSCRAYRADLVWQSWARRHCRGHRWRYHARHTRHVPYASGDALCQPVVPATGEQAQSEGNAYESAITAWRGEVRFLYGERFSDISKSRGLDKTCAPSSVPDSLRDKANPPLYRCRISARPCRVEARPLNKEED